MMLMARTKAGNSRFFKTDGAIATDGGPVKESKISDLKKTYNIAKFKN